MAHRGGGLLFETGGNGHVPIYGSAPEGGVRMIHPYRYQHFGAGVPPTAMDLRASLLPIRDQGSSNLCVPFTMACVKEWQDRENVLPRPEPFSVQWCWDWRSNQESTRGMRYLDCLEIVRRRGIAFERDYGFGQGDRSRLQSDTELLRRASNYKIQGYYRILSVEGVKQAMADGHGPVMLALPLFNTSDGFWYGPGHADEGHSVAVVGYDNGTQALLIRNSWGSDWALGGYNWFPYRDWVAMRECYACVDAASIPITLPPAPKEEGGGCRCC